MIRVGIAEVYVKPDGYVKPAFLAVIHGVNAKCAERGVEPIFGEPELTSDDYRSFENYPKARVIHVKDKNDGTIRIVALSDDAEDLFTEVWSEIKDRIAIQRYAHNIPGVNLEALEVYAYLDPR